MNKLKFDFRDLFLSMRIGFSVSKIWINGLGLLFSYLIYLIFTYSSLLLGGFNFKSIWERFGLIPGAFAQSIPWYFLLIYWMGMILSIFIILLTNTAVARLTYMALRNELFYSWIRALKFAFKKWISISGTFLTFIFLILSLILGSLITGLLGKIPFIGELGTALLTLPYLFATLILLFIIASFMVGLFLIPAIVSIADEDALGIVFHTFYLTYNYPWRIIGYGFIVGILEISSIFIFGCTLKFAYDIFIKLFSVSMGEKILILNTQASQLIDQSLPIIYNLTQKLPAEIADFLFSSQNFSQTVAVSEIQTFSSLVFAIFIFFAAGIVLAYGEAVGNAGLSIMFLILHKKRADENLLEREDEELAENNNEIEDEKHNTIIQTSVHNNSESNG